MPRFPELFIVGSIVLTIVMVFHCLLTRRLKASEKLLYMLPVIFIPVLGSCIYIFCLLLKYIDAQKKRALSLSDQPKEERAVVYQRNQSEWDEQRYYGEKL